MTDLAILEERSEVLELLGEYETLLTPKQRGALNDYYRFDLSLGEIAESSGVSRAAVHDAIAKTIAKMRDYEEKLHLVEKKKDIKNAISAIEKVEDANMKLELYRQLGKDLTDGI
ncbi:MAG: hypothetical protein K6B65_06075 [Bacilli bacterium]|nr:hypothetical protein [Bacilli bacterium]